MMDTRIESIKEAAKKKQDETADKKKKDSDDDGCATPGLKIRSKGKGRGYAKGRGHGPLGVPIGEKAMVGEEKTAIDLAYEEGVKLALNEYRKAAQAPAQTPQQRPAQAPGRSYTTPGKQVSIKSLATGVTPNMLNRKLTVPKSST